MPWSALSRTLHCLGMRLCSSLSSEPGCGYLEDAFHLHPPGLQAYSQHGGRDMAKVTHFRVLHAHQLRTGGCSFDRKYKHFMYRDFYYQISIKQVL